MSDYYSESSRTPTPHRRHRHHHHSKSKYDSNSDNDHSEFTIKQKRRMPLESSPLTFFFIIIVCSIIQIVSFGDCKLTFSRPNEIELPLAYNINRAFDAIPTFNLMDNLTTCPKEIILVSYLIYLIYRILCSTSRSPISSFLISIILLYDKATRSLIISNPSFGAQLILVSLCIICCQNLLVLQIFSSPWITYAALSLLLGFFSTFISIEAYPIFIPITISIILLSKSTESKSRSSFCSKIFNAILKSIYLIILCCACVTFAFGTYLLIGPPKFVVIERDIHLLITEFLSNNHNISLLFMAPLVLLLFFFTDIEFSWLLSFIGCLAFSIMLMFSSVVNDLVVQAGFCVYYYLLCCGFVLTNPKVSSVSAFLLMLELAIVINFYNYPI